MSNAIDLGVGILDRQLIDSEGRRCGKADDLELEGIRDGKPAVQAILAGPPAWRGRGRLGRLAAKVGRGRMVRISWDDVAEVKGSIHLRKPASELGLARIEHRLASVVEWIPGAK